MSKKEQTQTEKSTAFVEPVFLGCNERAKRELATNAQRLLNECKALAEVLTENGLQVTKETITDCLTMTRTTQRANAEGKRCVEVYANCTHLDEAFAKQAADEMDNVKARIIRNQVTESIKAEEIAFKDKILELRKKYAEVEFNNESTRKYLMFEGNEVSLPSDLENRCEQDTGFWINTDAQFRAWENHKLAADAITRFLKHFPKDVWPRTAAEIGNLFKVNENGEFEAQILDYASYIK